MPTNFLPGAAWGSDNPTPRLPKAASSEQPNILLDKLTIAIPFKNQENQDWALPKPRLRTAPWFDPPNLLTGTLVKTTPFNARVWESTRLRLPKAAPFGQYDGGLNMAVFPPPPYTPPFSVFSLLRSTAVATTGAMTATPIAVEGDLL